MDKLESNSEILTFGDRFVLFETSFINQPVFLFDAVSKIKALGFKPVLAHPERYFYLEHNQHLIEQIAEQGVYFQINLNSLSGYYSKSALRMAYQLIDKGLVNFLGSDCHHISHLEALRVALQTKLYQKVLGLDLLNYSV